MIGAALPIAAMATPDSNDLMKLFTEYRLAVGAIVPLLILAIGILGKKISRGAGWALDDFCVGSELTLAGMSGALVNLFDLLKPDRNFGFLERELTGANILVVVGGLVLYCLVLSFRQDFGSNRNRSLASRVVYLLGVSNILGLLTLGFALLTMAP